MIIRRRFWLAPCHVSVPLLLVDTSHALGLAFALFKPRSVVIVGSGVGGSRLASTLSAIQTIDVNFMVYSGEILASFQIPGDTVLDVYHARCIDL